MARPIPAMARLSSAAIAMSKKFLPPSAGPGQAADQPGLMAKLGAKTVVAATLRAVQLLGRQFVLGQTIEEGMSEADAARRKQPNLSYSYDMLGEGARTDADALQYLASYQNAIKKIAAKVHPTLGTERNDGISIKLSALHPRYEAAQQARVLRELVPRVWSLCELAARANISLTIDAEEVDRLELSLDVFEALAAQVAQHFPQWSGFGLALQSYQTRALELIEHVIALARKYRLRFMCRLVKGAYWDAEIKRAQELGLPHYPVFTHKHHTDVSYLACARALLAAPDAIYPQFATHNAGTIAAILQMAARPAGVDVSGGTSGLGGTRVRRRSRRSPRSGRGTRSRARGLPTGLRFRCDLIAGRVAPFRAAAPARHERRHLPRGAEEPAGHLPRLCPGGRAPRPAGLPGAPPAGKRRQFVLRAPAGRRVGGHGRAADVAPAPGSRNPSLPLPPDLFGPARPNSAGVDLTVAAMRAPLLEALTTSQVPVVAEFDVKTAPSRRDMAQVCYQHWSNVAVAERAATLRRAADALEQQLPRFCALLVKEAFKTWGDAVSEVREAVDFLRYYANEAERIMAPIDLARPHGRSNELRLTARGVWVCISPWNFPLAIFMGQVAAALATGNTVLAKPAEQTPGVALGGREAAARGRCAGGRGATAARPG